VRETVNITCGNLRAKEQVNIQEVLFKKLFNIYSFNFDGDDDKSMHIKKTVKHNALKIMTKALSMWQTMPNSKKGENFETYIKNRWPHIQEEDWKRFIASHSGIDFKKTSEWGKGMRKKNKHNHKLGDCGYLEKRSAKEDDSAQHAGKAAPFFCLKPVCRKDFMRACTKYDRVIRPFCITILYHNLLLFIDIFHI
jgi:hypothetical protein